MEPYASLSCPTDTSCDCFCPPARPVRPPNRELPAESPLGAALGLLTVVLFALALAHFAR